MFIGFLAGNERLYAGLRAVGFILIFKPTIIRVENGQTLVKGNIDAELVLYAAAIEYMNYDKAIIVTADGDFACLIKFLSERNKLLHILTTHKRYSGLLRNYSAYIVPVSRFKSTLQQK